MAGVNKVDAQDSLHPDVSVVMAVHNGQEHLVEALESIISQTFGNFEFLIVDDASSDDTPAILGAYAARDVRLRILRNESTLGPYRSANLALTQARARLVARMDADDVSEPERLARQVSFLDANPRCLLVGSGYRSVDADGRTRFVKLNPMTPEIARWTARLTMPMVHPSFCFRRCTHDGAPVLYDTRLPLAADYALAVRLSRLGDIASLQDPLVRYRMHAANISSTRRELQKEVARAIAAEAVAGHYPRQVLPVIDPLLDAIYSRRAVDGLLLRQAMAGMDAVLAFDGGQKPPAWMKQRAAALLAQSCLRGSSAGHAALLALRFALEGGRYLVPLIIRAAQVRNLLSQRADAPG